MYSSCPTTEISSFFRGVFSSSDSNSLDSSKLYRACILVIGSKISSRSYRQSDFTECQPSKFCTVPTGLVVRNEPVAFMMAAAAVGVVKTEGLADHICDRSLRRFSRHDCRACSRRAAGDSTSFQQDIIFNWY